MQKCCDASVCQPRQALDQLFIRIEKIVTGRLDIVEISEFEWLRERNGRACTLARVDEQGALSQVQKTTATNEGARVHRALPARIATLSGNAALKASTLRH